MIYRDRHHAGRELARQLAAYADREDVVVLGLPRGGVPVAYEVAQALHVPLDIFLVRKLGLPGNEEYAMGAIASGGVQVLVDRAVEYFHVDPATIRAVAEREGAELRRRERAYRGDRPEPELAGKTAILVDDGLATGASMRAAVQALRRHRPRQIIVAVPVAAEDSCDRLRREADDVVCGSTPEPFAGVGRWYRDFSQTIDEEVQTLLAEAKRQGGGLGARADTWRPSDTGREDFPASDDATRQLPGGTPATPSGSRGDERALHALRRHARPLEGHDGDYDALLERIGDARLVLIGEATHGTEEFYRMRAAITRRLIAERGFGAVAVEADWPDSYRVNRYVRGRGEDLDAERALAGFRRFPTWMWRNTEVLDFVEWLREHNLGIADLQGRVGFYGLDLYSLHASMAAVIDCLDGIDPAAAERARARYACFEDFGDDPQAYGYAAGLGLSESCQSQALAQLVELSRRVLAHDGSSDDELFFAEQNARLVHNAEAYYRSMFGGRQASWNLRDTHMMDTLESVLRLARPDGTPLKAVVWAHNSHLGDARATEMGASGELNLGQLARERYGEAAVLIGFSTHTGTVTAAHDWDAPPHRMRVRPGLAGSWEALLHRTELPRFQLSLGEPGWEDALALPRLQRAIGVLYRPRTERQSHYFRADLRRQFDWMFHLDETTALRPLDPGTAWHSVEPPETWPSGL